MNNTSDKQIDLSRFLVRKVANGWVIDINGMEDHYHSDRVFVFETLKKMYKWLKKTSITPAS